MGTPAKPEKKVDYPVHEMKEKGRLVLPPKIIAQIQFLHSHCGTDEWSAILLYDVISGNPSEPKDFELEVKHIFLMDIGTAAATEYEPDGDIVDIFDEIPEAMEWKMGHIHTHHSGSTYFSNVDTSELQENVDKHNYYLSLVVNFNGNYSAKVVFLSEVETKSKMNYLDDSGKTVNFEKTDKEQYMVSIDMRILYGEIGGFFSNRLKQIKKKKKDEEAATAARRTHVGGFGGGYGGYGGNFGGQGWDANRQRHLPAHNQRAISSKIIPDHMTSWEIEKLTKNILALTPDLSTVTGNVYSLLHQIRNDEAASTLYPDYLMNTVEDVINNYFDEALEDNEMLTVLNEVIMCIMKFEAQPVLAETVTEIVGILNMVGQVYLEDTVDEGEKDIADQLEKAEEELKDA